MAKLEYSAECLCGGDILTTFKKPTRFRNTVSRTHCQGCGSEFMFTCSIEYNDKGRAYVTSHEVIDTKPKLEDAAKAKKEELQKGEKT